MSSFNECPVVWSGPAIIEGAIFVWDPQRATVRFIEFLGWPARCPIGIAALIEGRTRTICEDKDKNKKQRRNALQTIGLRFIENLKWNNCIFPLDVCTLGWVILQIFLKSKARRLVARSWGLWCSSWNGFDPILTLRTEIQNPALG